MRNNLEKLKAWRIRTGMKPVSVWLWYGFGRMPHKGRFDLDADKPSKTDDYRPLVGLNVTVCAKSYSPALMEEFERMKGYASSLVLWVDAWKDDPESVITWRKGEKSER